MVWSGMGWCPEGPLEALEPRRSCCNLVFSRKLWHLQLEEQNNTLETRETAWLSMLQSLYANISYKGRCKSSYGECDNLHMPLVECVDSV